MSALIYKRVTLTVKRHTNVLFTYFTTLCSAYGLTVW